MNKYLSKIVGAVASLALVIGAGVGIANDKNVVENYADPGDSVTWTWTAASSNKISTTSGETSLSGKIGSTSVSISASTSWTGGDPGNYESSSYGGQQMGTGSSNMTAFSLTFGNPWGGTGTYKDYIKITSISLSGSCGSSTTYTVSASVGGVAANNTNSTTTLFAGTGKTPNTCIFAPATGHEKGAIVINVNKTSGSKAWYLTSVSITAEIPDSITPSYYVTYDANGGLGTLSDGNSPYDSGTTVTVLANTFTRDGYTFNRWNTAADGSGVSYSPGATFSIGVDTTLYAQWTALPRTVTYDSNGATSGTVPSDATIYSDGATVTVKGNTGSLMRADYTWCGWNTKSDGTGTYYAAGATFNISIATTLYAHWIKDYSSQDTLIITADYLNLDNTGITSAATLHAVDGFEYYGSPNGASAPYRAITTSGSNKFNSEASIYMGKNGAYLYNKIPYQKNVARIELFSNNGASKAVNVAVAFGVDICDESYTTGNINFGTDNTVYTFKSSVANARYFRVQVTNSNNTQIQIRVVFEKPTTSISISPESVTLAPTETQQLSPTVLPAGATDDIVYASDDEDVATVSDDGLITAVAAGTATITATSGSYSDTCEVTVAIPVVPFVTLDSDSTSGYTGQNDTIPFLYGNLTGTLNVAVQNANATALIKNDDGDGYAEVQVSFVNAGSCEVYVKDGLTTLATITATITASTVTITGLPTAEVMANNRCLDLGELITITALGSFSDDATWSSSTPSVATVDGSGVVSSVAIGSTTITVTPDDYPAGAVSCNVTVANIVNTTFVAGTDTSETTSLTKSAITISVEQGTFVRNDNYRVNSGKDVTISSSKGNIVKILFVCTSEGYNQLTGVGCSKYGKNTIWTGDADSITLNSTASQSRINKIVVTIKSAATGDIKNITTSSALSYTDYNDEGDGSFTFTNLAVRLGGLVSKTLWDKLGAETEIQGYGVIFSTDAYLDTDTIRDYYNIYKTSDNTVDEALAEFCDGTNIINYSNAATNHEPALKTTPSLVGDNYRWNLYLSVPVANRTDVLVAVAYIKIDGDILFLRETRVSASSLADDLIESGEYEENAFGGSLKYLAGRP